MMINIPVIGLSFANIKKFGNVMKLPAFAYAGLRNNLLPDEYGLKISAGIRKKYGQIISDKHRINYAVIVSI